VVALATGAAEAQDSTRTPTLPRLRGASKRELYFGATAGAATAAFSGIVMTSAVYSLACNRRHPDRPADLFGLDRCTFASDESLKIGWHGGSFVGAAGVAATVAVWRGCPKRHATWRALTGAAVGTLPGLIAASHSPTIAGPRTKLIAVTPIIAGVGAATAVVTCRAK